MFLSYDLYYLLQIEPLIFPTTTQLPSLSRLICPSAYSTNVMGKLSPAPAVHLTTSQKQHRFVMTKENQKNKNKSPFVLTV